MPTINSGGAEKQAVLLSTLLSKNYIVNLIILYGKSPEYNQNIESLLRSNVNVYRLYGNLFSKIRKIRLILIESKTQVLFNYLSFPDFIGSYLGNRLCIRSYNGIRTTTLGVGKEMFERFAHNHWTTGTIFNSFSGCSYFTKHGFDVQKSFVIPNGFSGICDITCREEKCIKTIISVGRFDPAKDYKTLIRSVACLDRNDYRLCIVGYGLLEKQIRGWVKEFGIESKTDIVIKPDNVLDLEKNADIYLSTSLFEGTSNSIMEALNCSLPIVATKVGDNDRLVIDGKNGYLHPIGDVVGLSHSLNRLLDSLTLRNEMGKMSNRILKENYSIDLFEKRYVDLIEK